MFCFVTHLQDSKKDKSRVILCLHVNNTAKKTSRGHHTSSTWIPPHSSAQLKPPSPARTGFTSLPYTQRTSTSAKPPPSTSSAPSTSQSVDPNSSASAGLDPHQTSTLPNILPTMQHTQHSYQRVYSSPQPIPSSFSP